MNIEARLKIDRRHFQLNTEFTIPMRGITVILGKSGSGKTTLLRAISGLDYQSGNMIRVGGTVWQDDRQFLPVYKRALGYVFQSSTLFPHLTVSKNLAYGFNRTQTKHRRIDFNRTVEKTGIGSLLKRKTGELSGGESQRVAIARALLSSPKVLLMDESLASLDPQSKNKLLIFLETIVKEFTIPVFYVTHSREDAIRLADYVFVMENGRFVSQGTLDGVFMNFNNPLQDWDAESIIDATTGIYDAQFELNRFEFRGGAFLIPGERLQEGTVARLRIPAKSVSLVVNRPKQSSILNTFAVTVTDIKVSQSPYVMVKLNAGGSCLLSLITKKSASTLRIKTGDALFAQIKSVSIPEYGDSQN